MMVCLQTVGSNHTDFQPSSPLHRTNRQIVRNRPQMDFSGCEVPGGQQLEVSKRDCRFFLLYDLFIYQFSVGNV